ncbi:hypothetical protein HU200_013956 [Digitaria exilis]|uniref:RBR-type E3 ubiquitin transferase n=1 Tax=Digitaria exilis TaxID=1010633 RepID=A0A835KJ78_9POAL|nr:hypothetical protein HU200_013956 [Digitaria exilis]
MATGGGDGDGSCHRNKRCHGFAGVEDDDTHGDPGHFPGDSDNGSIGDDFIYDEDSAAAAGEEYPDVEETFAGDSSSAASAIAGKKGYAVLTEDDILERQKKAATDVAEVLSISRTFATVLLRHFKWSPSHVEEEWFSDDGHVRSAVGLPPANSTAVVAMAFSPKRLTCGICFTKFYAGKMRSAGCSHFYCDPCWRMYIHVAVGDGPRCLSLRCPEPECSAAVVGDLVDAVADNDDKDWHARFALRSYVEDSGGSNIKWCPAAGCDLAVELVGDGEVNDVFCACRHGFCWRCGDEAHRPVSCDTVRAWLAKNSSDAESANWVLANTKLCPKCRRPIEKNQGCNHMSCRSPCYHQFCWLCLDPWNRHRGCSGYGHDQFVDDKSVTTGDKQSKEARKEEMRRRQAKASLDRYLYHYERWAANKKSLQKAIADMEELEKKGLKKMTAVLEVEVADLKFLTKAYELIVDGRRVMRWVYAYGYYLDPVRDKAKRGLFDHLQDDANSRLESLQSCAELERRKFIISSNEKKGGADMNEMYRVYKSKLVDLTSATRHYFGNLVKAFETDMPEFNSV